MQTQENVEVRDLLSLKRKELAFILGYFYSDYDLASLVHPLSKYTSSLVQLSVYLGTLADGLDSSPLGHGP